MDFLARQPLSGSISAHWPRIEPADPGKDGALGEAHLLHRQGDSPYFGGVYADDVLTLAWTGLFRDRRGWTRGLDVDGKASERVGAAFRRHRQEAMEQLAGAVAVIAWDRRDGTLRVYRDALGLIPLYWSLDAGAVVVSSNADWLAADLERRRGVNRRRLVGFMTGSMDSDRDDFLEGVHRIRPGEMACWDGDRVPHYWTWWRPAPLEVPNDEAPERVIETLSAIVDETLPPESMVAMSGGLDSAVLAGLLVRSRRTSFDGPVEVASLLTPRLARGDEREAIEDLVRALPLRVHGFAADAHWPLKEFEIYGEHLGMGPHFHPEETYVRAFHRWLEGRASPGALAYGNGADDVLWCPAAVYRRSLLAQGRWREAMACGGAAAALRSAAGLVIDRWGWEGLRASVPLRSGGGGDEGLIWRHPRQWVLPHQGWDGESNWSAPTMTWREHRLARLQTWKWELVCRTLNREARRAPFGLVFPMLDREFWALCLSIDTTQLVERGRQKAVLRQGATTLLPSSAVRRRKHGGFDALVEYGLACRESQRVVELFSSSALSRERLIDRGRFLKAFDAYREADPVMLGRPYRGSLGIWHTIAAELWLSCL